MTVETDFRALLAAHAPLTALVSTRIVQDVADEGAPVPLVIFGAVHDRAFGLDNLLMYDHVTLAVQCWGATGASASAVADAVVAAIATAPAARGAHVTDRSTTFDAETGLDGVLLTCEWWQT